MPDAWIRRWSDPGAGCASVAAPAEQATLVEGCLSVQAVGVPALDRAIPGERPRAAALLSYGAAALAA